MSVLTAQTGTEALFKKGTELEFRSYGRKSPISKKLVELTTITLIVTDVKDSNSITYSYVTKKAHAATNALAGYEKRYILSRTNDKITLPQDLYITDTVYSVDMGYKGNKIERPYATAAIKGVATYVISGDISKGSFASIPKTITVEGSMLSYDMNANSVNFGFADMTKWRMEATTKGFSVGPKTKITTAAGTFECYKITAVVEVKAMGGKMETTSQMYYSPEYGVLKTEPGESDQDGGMELSKVKKGEE